MAQIKTNQYSITDDAVTLAKMASGTDGNIITYDASGNPAVVASGTSGHFLKSQGADTVPVFAAAAGGKILQVIYQSITTNTAIATATYTDFFTQAITPATNSDVLISFNLQSYHTEDDRGYGIKILRGASAIYTSATQYALNYYHTVASQVRQKSSFYFVDTAPSGDGATVITYKIQVGTNGGRSVTFSNNNNSSELILMEIGA